MFLKVFLTLFLIDFSLCEEEVQKVFLRSNQSRIVNGEILDIESVPYYASMCKPPDFPHFCGSAIISPLWLLSAAHCYVSIMDN